MTVRLLCYRPNQHGDGLTCAARHARECLHTAMHTTDAWYPQWFPIIDDDLVHIISLSRACARPATATAPHQLFAAGPRSRPLAADLPVRALMRSYCKMLVNILDCGENKVFRPGNMWCVWAWAWAGAASWSCAYAKSRMQNPPGSVLLFLLVQRGISAG